MATEQIKEVKKDIGKYSALDALKDSEGGQLLIESLASDIASCIEELSSKYKTASHSELIAIGAKIAERLSLYRTLNRAKKNKKLASEELKAILAESE